MNDRSFHSLRYRMLIPLVGAACFAALAIGVVSYWFGDRTAVEQLTNRFDEVTLTLQRATFPLTRSVLDMLSELTEAEFVTYAADGRRLESTFSADQAVPKLLQAEIPIDQLSNGEGQPFPLEGYLAQQATLTRRSGNDATSVVFILFPDQAISQARWRAALLPLLTGLSTMLLMSLVAGWLSSRLIMRIGRLQRGVQRIAAGDFEFEATPEESPEDELGVLSNSVQRMGRELKRLWSAVRKQESERLIHLFAAGLAHQLRNSLTGARMAVELHSQRCGNKADDRLNVALQELERTEDYVQRILLVAAGDQETQPEAGTLRQAVEEIRRGISLIAAHQKKTLVWEIRAEDEVGQLNDYRALAVALQNLVLNALQAGGDYVVVRSHRVDEWLRIEVEDNGQAPPGRDAMDIFEPFVTTKPEGMGLGLALVRQAATRLGGKADFSRTQSGLTRFEFVVPWVVR